TIIVWNEEGEILATQAVIHSNIANPFTTEAYAGLQAIKLGIRLGVNKIEVMGDSKTIIKKCQSSSTDKSETSGQNLLIEESEEFSTIKGSRDNALNWKPAIIMAGRLN
ncbi:hypothetical protein Golob_018950, partial [Gossypium lobatum]|nr:hypothetical protein [Gossypium lobatum]